MVTLLYIIWRTAQFQLGIDEAHMPGWVGLCAFYELLGETSVMWFVIIWETLVAGRRR